MIKKRVHYVDNKKLTEEVAKYSASYKEAQKKNPDSPILPKMNDYIGKAILLIATNINNSPNFYMYPFKSEMVGDGIMNCVRYLHNFNIEKSKNAFAYISQICYYSSLHRIKLEKKQKHVKVEMVKNAGILEDMQFEKHDEDAKEYFSNYISYYLEQDSEKDKEESAKYPKRTTKAHQKKLKELDEKIKSAENGIMCSIEQEEEIEQEETDKVSIEEYFTDSEY